MVIRPVVFCVILLTHKQTDGGGGGGDSSSWNNLSKVSPPVLISEFYSIESWTQQLSNSVKVAESVHGAETTCHHIPAFIPSSYQEQTGQHDKCVQSKLKHNN